MAPAGMNGSGSAGWVAERANTVTAAGGLVCRSGPAGLVEVALVHRPRYGDWSFPKGKQDEDETLREACVREVREETGLTCTIARPVACTGYLDHKGRDKIVFYWVLEPVSGSFEPNQEVDQVRWLTVPDSLGLLSYDRDRALLKLAALR